MVGTDQELTIQAESIRTQHYSKYTKLVRQVGSENESEIYPFQFGYELFTFALYHTYINEQDVDISDIGEWSGDDEISTDEIVRISEISGNDAVLYSIELLAQILHSEVKQSVGDDTPTPELWEVAKAYADSGVEDLYSRWSRERSLPAEATVKGRKEFWIECVESLNQLSGPPTSETGELEPS